VGWDSNGNADFFGLSNDSHDQLWRWTSTGGWTALGSHQTVWQISAATNGQVDYIAMDGSLRKYDGNGYRHDLSYGLFSEVSGAGDNDVYVVTGDSNYFLQERTAGGNWITWDSGVW